MLEGSVLFDMFYLGFSIMSFFYNFAFDTNKFKWEIYALSKITRKFPNINLEIVQFFVLLLKFCTIVIVSNNNSYYYH